MEKPTRKEVREMVMNMIARFCNIDQEIIKLSWQLQNPPLKFDDNRLGFLAISFRGYVYNYSNKQNTVLARELRKSGLTVDNLIDLIYKKVK